MRNRALLLAALVALAAGCTTPGDLNPRWPHVVASPSGNWQPAPGYTWIYPNDGNDLSVRWEPGKGYWYLDQLKWPHVHASRAEGRWIPAPGYVWVDPSKDLSVRWEPGAGYWYLGENVFPNVVAHEQEGAWIPQSGYEWAHPGPDGRPKPGDLAVVATADRLAREQRQRERHARDEILARHWVEYLKQIQAQNAYPNWSAPPYDLYVRHHQ